MGGVLFQDGEVWCSGQMFRLWGLVRIRAVKDGHMTQDKSIARSLIGSAAIMTGLATGLMIGTGQAGAQCVQPALNCQAYSTSFAAQSTSTSDVAPGAAISAENLTFQSAGVLSSVCFWGRYSGVAPDVNTETFRITVYADGGGFPGAVIAGPWNFGGASPTPGAMLARGGALPATAGANAFSWTATFPAGLNVNAAECVWVEVAGNATSAANAWTWLTVNDATGAPTADGAYARRSSASSVFTIDDRRAGFDLAMCASAALASGGCAPTPASNATCDGAIALGSFPAMQSATTVRGLLQPTVFCQSVLVGARTLWYSFVGDGTTVTLSTCDPATNYDTVLSVYCGTCAAGNNAGLNCAASNDDAPGVCSGSMASGRASSLTMATRAGTAYLIGVTGFGGQAGSFVLRATSDGVVLAPASQPSCVPMTCTLNIAGTSPGEGEVCGGASLNGECDDAGVITLTLGTTYRATMSATGTRDIDFFTIGGVPSGGASYDIAMLGEFPASVVVYGGSCSGGGTNPGAILDAVTVPACSAPSGGVTLQVDVPGGAGGGARVLVTTPDFAGLPCGASNTYTLRVTQAAAGACCVLGQACVVVTQNSCTNLGGGAWYGPGSACTAPSGGGDGCETVACCSPSGACAARTASDCTAAGLLAGASFSVCSPNPCPQPPSVCCRGATCATNVASTLCAGANTLFLPMLTACNTSINATTPCCHADFNKQAGVTIQDVFDFLTAWFAGDSFANISNNGVGTPTVQSVFDYLTVWFAGGC